MNLDKHLEEWSNYNQEGPTLGNQFLEDTTLRNYLNVMIPKAVGDAIQDDLVAFGDKVSGKYLEMAHLAEEDKPYFIKYDAFGKQVNEIRTSEGWKFFKPEAAKEGLIAIAYEQNYAQYSRVYQIIKLYLFAPSSGLYSCPLAMTDGAAFTFQQLKRRKDFKSTPEIEDAYSHLTSRDPQYFWTSGQWMTEKKGGSDVSGGTTTLAIPSENNKYQLYGYKWFTSATDADMTLTLARSVVDGKPISGGKGLSMFFSKVKDEKGTLNNLELIRLKDKMGTRLKNSLKKWLLYIWILFDLFKLRSKILNIIFYVNYYSTKIFVYFKLYLVKK